MSPQTFPLSNDVLSYSLPSRIHQLDCTHATLDAVGMLSHEWPMPPGISIPVPNPYRFHFPLATQLSIMDSGSTYHFAVTLKPDLSEDIEPPTKLPPRAITNPNSLAMKAGLLQYDCGLLTLSTIARAIERDAMKPRHSLFKRYSPYAARHSNALPDQTPYQPIGPWRHIPNQEPLDYALRSTMNIPKKKMTTPHMHGLLKAILRNLPLIYIPIELSLHLTLYDRHDEVPAFPAT